MNRGRYEVKSVMVRLQDGRMIDLEFPPGEAHYVIGGNSKKIPGGRNQVWKTHELHWRSDFREEKML